MGRENLVKGRGVRMGWGKGRRLGVGGDDDGIF